MHPPTAPVLIAFLITFLPCSSCVVVPASPKEMVSRAAASIRRSRERGNMRQVVNIVVPIPETVLPEGQRSIWDQDDPIDPWPGGLKQQYPYALELGRALLGHAVLGNDGSDSLQDEVLDAEDACGLIMVQGTSPADDAALLLFPGCDQLGELERVDQMCGDRLMILLNPQFRRPADFGLFQQALVGQSWTATTFISYFLQRLSSAVNMAAAQELRGQISTAPHLQMPPRGGRRYRSFARA